MDYKGIIIFSKDIEMSIKVAENLINMHKDKYSSCLSETDLIIKPSNFTRTFKKKSLIFISYRNDVCLKSYNSRYIIKDDNIKIIIKNNLIPIIVIPECFLLDYINSHIENSYMSVWIDKKDVKKSTEDKIYEKCIYRLTNNNLDDTCQLIDKFWCYRNTGGALSRDYITKMLKCNVLITNSDMNNVSNASYDLRLGDEYYYSGEIKTLDKKHPFIPLEPYDYVIVSCKEMMAFPRDVIARFDLAVKLFFEGIILSNGTQVDPGFNGKLFCMLFNTSNKIIYLKREMVFSTIEFNKLIEPTSAYSGKYAYEENMEVYLPTDIMRGAMNELKKDVENLRKENKEMQTIYLASLAIIVAILAFFVSKQ